MWLTSFEGQLIQTWLWVLTNHGKDRTHSFPWLAAWQGEKMVHQYKKSLTSPWLDLTTASRDLTRPPMWSKYLIFWYKPTPFDQSREVDLSSFLWLVKIETWWRHYTAGKRSCSKSFVFCESRSGNWKSRIQNVIASFFLWLNMIKTEKARQLRWGNKSVKAALICWDDDNCQSMHCNDEQSDNPTFLHHPS